MIHSFLQHVDEENSYLCGYLKIKGLTEEFPTLTTFFDGEIISKRFPFLTRKWDADEDVDKKHWVTIEKPPQLFFLLKHLFSFLRRASFYHSASTPKPSIQTHLTMRGSGKQTMSSCGGKSTS